ncbi:hypothetical protein psyc5s11_53770 [Clostridium gelidum]|uniref:Uncharacterized protein n=1 Tax=Clostridium gelidum TaxID=704125 RepID=A0ABM7TDG9_9CLOT|nr:hypothetical protein [Clostridium gelidum]BCZ49310.1 hypothetical protein psyc5s11_53770 [Clostridium gelidum]
MHEPVLLSPLLKIIVVISIIDTIVTILCIFIELLGLIINKFISNIINSIINKKIKTILANIAFKCKSINTLNFNIELNHITSLLITCMICLYSVEVFYRWFYFGIHFLGSKFNLNADACAYLSLTLLLTAISYYPEKIFLSVLVGANRVFSKIRPKKNNTIKLAFYRKIVILMRPKLWVYLISVFITIINSIERISNIEILSNQLWLQIKPVVIEAVLTMIVIDRFINLLKNEYTQIKNEVKEIKRESKEIIYFEKES